MGKLSDKIKQVKGDSAIDLMSQKGVTELVKETDKRVDSIDNLLSEQMESLFSYGVEIDSAKSSPLLTRIGNMTLHTTLPIQRAIKGCLLNNEGTVNYYLDPIDWTKKANGTASNLDGTDGDVMSERPQLYIKFKAVSNTVTHVLISDRALIGFTLVEKGYLGAYQATLDRTTGQMRSIVNFAANFRGGNNNAAYDGAANSFLGRPASDKSLTEFRTAARIGRSERFSPVSYFERNIRTYLFYIEYANLNSQAAVVGLNPSTGLMEGGLGVGVTTADWGGWNTFNGSSPFIPCGVSNSLGSSSGEVNYTAVDFKGAGVSQIFTVPRYRGVENPFGHLSEWTDGVLVDVKTDAEGGTSKLYTTKDPAKFNSVSFGDYEYKGLLPRMDGFIKELINGEIIPKTVGGDSATRMCDHYYQYIISGGLRGVLFGGATYQNETAGLVFSDTGNAPSIASAKFGARLCFL